MLATIPGCAAYGSLALASRIGSIERFPRPASLANYWGLTPGCRNSGETTDRLGSITKQGSAMARFILGQTILHVLRRDASMKAWCGRIKRRRGSKIARVAVMRRLATVIWHMVKHNEPYVIGGPPRRKLRDRKTVGVGVAESPSARARRKGASGRPLENEDKERGNVAGGCIGPSSPEEEALACKASLSVPVDSAFIAERNSD